MRKRYHVEFFLALTVVLWCFFPLFCMAQDKVPEEPFTMQEVSSFLDMVDDQQYEEIPASTEAVLFRWDFSEKKEVSYNFQQKTINQTLMNSFDPDEESNVVKQNITGNGLLSYKSEGNKTARLVIENLVIKTVTSAEFFENSPKTMEMESPPLVIQGVKEDGNLLIPSSSQTLLLKLLFPLPERPIKVSETIKSETNLPFNAMGSALYVKGNSRLTLEKYVNINGVKCAKFVTDINISEIDMPPEMEGKYKALAKGKSVFYFDLKNRKFIGGKLAFLMTMDVETKFPKNSLAGDEEEPGKMPEKVRMATNSDNLITLSNYR